MVTVVDSGVSCTLLPTELFTIKGIQVNIYEAVKRLRESNASVFIEIGGQEFEIPLTGCFAPNTQSNVLTLGDSFFRGKVVVHDLSERTKPRLGIALQKVGYTPSTGGRVSSPRDVNETMATNNLLATNSTSKFTTLRLWKQKRNTRQARVDSVGVSTYDQNIYFTILQVGTPRQAPFVVQIDTGSSLTAIFSQSHPSPPSWQVAVLVVAIVVPVVALAIGGFVYCGRKMRRMEEEKRNKDLPA